MDGKKEKREHRLTIDDRKRGTISGVIDVPAFDEHEIILETEQGLLCVNGNDLRISRLTLEKGEVDLEGLIETLCYRAGREKKAHSLKSLFR